MKILKFILKYTYRLTVKRLNKIVQALKCTRTVYLVMFNPLIRLYSSVSTPSYCARKKVSNFSLVIHAHLQKYFASLGPNGMSALKTPHRIHSAIALGENFQLTEISPKNAFFRASKTIPKFG